jgi:DNA-binding winged helix-turn-helix (wHTH) protein
MSRQKGQITQCIYSLRKALHRDSGDVGVLFELASIYRLRGEASKVSATWYSRS